MSWNKGLDWQLENTLSYNKTINDHTFEVLLGQSAKKNKGAYLGAYSKYLIALDYDRLYPDFTTGNSANADERNGWGADNADHTLASLFARVSYDYKSRYMIFPPAQRLRASPIRQSSGKRASSTTPASTSTFSIRHFR